MDRWDGTRERRTLWEGTSCEGKFREIGEDVLFHREFSCYGKESLGTSPFLGIVSFDISRYLECLRQCKWLVYLKFIEESILCFYER
jgi:hypothetical protein